MKNKILNFLVLFIILFRSFVAHTQSKGFQDATIEIDVDLSSQNADSAIRDEGYSQRIEEIFRNPVIATGLDQGADALNRSLESIMDSVFYSLLDNDKRFGLTKSSWFQMGLRRNLLSASDGRYIVVDRFYLGPGYKQKIFETGDLGWTFGAEATGEILQIYVLTDGKRVYGQSKIGSIRAYSNNWFGILPILSAVLPPSFNQNELYDPVTELETPVTFPLDLDKFEEMPIGSIRSYNLAGGIRITPDLAELLPAEKREYLKDIANLSPMFPISFFKRGEHRISVFRKQSKKAWIGVNDLNRKGVLFEGSIGTLYAVFKNAMSLKFGSLSWVWGGIPISFTPLNFTYQKSVAKLFDQVFEYDLSYFWALECYKSAVRGDFLESQRAALDTLAGKETGVSFQFARNQNREEKTNRKGPNIALFRDVREISQTKSEIEIKDTLGKYNILEASTEITDKKWNILVGEQEERFYAVVEMAAMPLINPQGHKSFIFQNPDNPYRVTLNFQIEDRYTNSIEFNDYMDILRRVSGMPLVDIQRLPVRDSIRSAARAMELQYLNPEDTQKKMHVSPIALGRFSGQVSISLPYIAFKEILNIHPKFIADKISHIFEQDISNFPRDQFKSLFFKIIAEPFDMLNFRWSALDRLDFTEKITDGLARIRKSVDPEQQLDGFFRLISTHYPREFMELLLKLNSGENVNRAVKITTKALGNVDLRFRSFFQNLNEYKKEEGKIVSPVSRYGQVKEKISQFYLDKPHVENSNIDLSHIQITTKMLPIYSIESWNDSDSNPSKDKEVFVSVEVHGRPHIDSFKIYVRLEEFGRVQLGKFDLGEVVVESNQLERVINDSGRVSHGFYVTGSQSPLGKSFSQRFLRENGQLRLILSVSRDGESWSAERIVDFAMDNGVLKQLKQ